MSDNLSDPPPYEPPPAEEDFYEWEAEDERTGPGILWFRIVALIVGLFLVFFLGRITGGDGGVDESELTSLQQENTQLQDEVAQLQTDLEAAETASEPDPTETAGGAEDDDEDGTDEGGETSTETESYEVQSGDSFQLIAEDQYSDIGLAECIAEANGLTLDSTILPGDTLELPAAESC